MTTTLHPQFITDENGKRLMAVLPIADYEELLENLEDLAAIAERNDEASMPFEDAVKAIGYAEIHD